LGEAYSFGKGVTKDTKRARELYQRACDAGNKRGCANLKARKF
jgi:TPR repeat protein